MHAEADARLGFQPDIYQRYGFLALLVSAVFGPREGREGQNQPESATRRCRLLDVGCGPARLAETFLPAWVDVSRTDVKSFGDEAIVVMPADGSLPFEDRSFDIVLAMDVLEHVPAEQRPALIADCQRVAARAAIIAGPVRLPEVIAAEGTFADMARTVSNRELEFLAEHARYGLPERDAILGALGRNSRHVVAVDNSPLGEWEIYNAIDFLYANDVGEGEAKRATNTHINTSSVFRRELGPHYRLFACAFSEAADAAIATELAASPTVVGPPLSALELAVRCTGILARLRRDLRDSLASATAGKDLHIARLDQLILENARRHAEERQDLVDAVEAKDVHIEKLVRAAQKEVSPPDTRRAARQLAAQAAIIADLQRKIETLTSDAAALRSSYSWKVTAPARALAGLARGTTDPQSPPRRLAAAAALGDADQQAYRDISDSALFDADFYAAQSPDVASSGTDPLTHYIRSGAAEGRDPHPLFDSAYYLSRTPDAAATGLDPLTHYLRHGARAGLDPHPLFDTSYYLAQLRDVSRASVNPLRHYLETGGRDGLKPHPLFDSSFYLEHNPDVAAAGMNPLVHYLRLGGREGRHPHPLFDGTWYVERYPDVAGVANPLLHYVRHGAAEGRQPHPLFDTAFYGVHHPDIQAAGLDPLADYIRQGAAAGRQPHPLFDSAYYVSQHPEAIVGGIEPLSHYLLHGTTPGFDPHPLFDTGFYLAEHTDVAAAGLNPLRHYVENGGKPGFDPHPLFDTAFYLEQSPDVAGGTVAPLVHYLEHGSREGRRAHPLFDAQFYLEQNADVQATDIEPLIHYVMRGSREGRQPHPLFDSKFYLSQRPDVGTSGLDAVAHYIRYGAREGVNPHPLFDTAFYLAQLPQPVPDDINPVRHYLESGAGEGLNPHPLFATRFYLQSYPDVAAAGINPLVHYVEHGGLEGRNPHPLFDGAFYQARNPEAAAAGLDPLLHFLTVGAREGRDPHPSFVTRYYLERYPDVAGAGINPLVHFVRSGASEGRRTSPTPAIQHGDGYIPRHGVLPWFDPLAVTISAALSSAPRLNVLVPGLAMRHMSGGPNTAIALACALAEHGVAIRLLSTDAAVDSDPAPFWNHVRTLAGRPQLPPTMELADAHDRSRPVAIGLNDLFLATAWWTAQQAKYATRFTRQQTFLYLIQDYEPLLHAASTQYALASETYALAHVPIINTAILHEFLSSQRIGRFADDDFAGSALVFEPALDQSIFHPPDLSGDGRPRRLLFYARPTNGLRNLFELGVAALQKAIGQGAFAKEPWEFLGMGETFAPVELGSGAVLRPAKWVTLEAYARQMRDSDVLLSLMLSPHPSYPPLEMAASAGLVVTTTFANKTADRLARISPNIIGVAPTIEAVTAGLEAAIHQLPHRDQRLADARLELPASWSASFAPILPRLLEELALLQGSPTLSAEVRTERAPSRVFPGFRDWATNAHDVRRRTGLIERRARYLRGDGSLISFLTTVWNTDPAYLASLAASVLGQDIGTAFEWIVLDNGSERADTQKYLAQLAQHDCVRLHRIDTNMGIIGGMRFCLERATRRYVVPLDSDDLLTPDAVRVLTHALAAGGYPPLAFSDEDKLEGAILRDPFFKPDWDPVLFANSCYIAHVCVIDRRLALELEAYTDRETEGSHDWDTFARFYLAGYTPLHVPEVLYTWRMHETSTAGNIGSKPYVVASQRRVLDKLLKAAPEPTLYDVQPSPLFAGSPDWWIRRVHRDPWPVTTVLLGAHGPETRAIALAGALPHEIVCLEPADGVRGLARIAARCAQGGRLVHMLWTDSTIEDDEWPWEAMAHLELFPDTVMIGGAVHEGRRISTAGRYFGFGWGCDTPDRGRLLTDPGYFAQMWKPHSVSAVSIHHAVVRAEFLRDALEPLAASGVSLAGLGPWLGAAARKAGRRVVYSPFFRARSSLDLDRDVSEIERAAFRSANRVLIPEDRYLSFALGLTHDTAYRPVEPQVRLDQLDAAGKVDSYDGWTAAESLARTVVYHDAKVEPTFALLTTVYAGTNADLFRETARSLFAQTTPFAQWIVLAHGPIPPQVDRVLQECAADARVQVLRRDDNLGIIGGLGLCLRHATADVTVPMDADDLLVPDALRVLGAELAATGADLIYSDEDTYRDGTAQSPFFRPDFDPVLNGECSYIWHLCAFRREVALQLGVYEDAGAEYCHDWDTVTRFARAGKRVAHAAHVLYHWRAHHGSHSNSGATHPGSLASTKFVLARTIAAQTTPALYRVAPFPLPRGAEEWWIERLPADPPAITALILRGAEPATRTTSALRQTGFPFHAVYEAWSGPGESCSSRLSQALDNGAEYVLITGGELDDLDAAGIWEAIKLFELHPAASVVSGRLLDRAGTTIDCGRIADARGRLRAPFVGLVRDDPGPFAMALKAHRVLCPAAGLFVLRASLLRRALSGQQYDLASADPAAWLGACAAAGGDVVAYSPLLQAVVSASHHASLLRYDPARAFWSILADMGVAPSRLPRILSTAGFLNAPFGPSVAGKGREIEPGQRGNPLEAVLE